MSLNLSLCSMLHKLCLYLDPKIAIDEQSLDMLRSMLSLWDADVPLQRVYLSPNYECEFTRQAYADLLRKIGQVLEWWLEGSVVLSGAEGGASKQHTKRKICVRLYDWEVWNAWWQRHIKECFPTFAKSCRLGINYVPRECRSDILSMHMSHFVCCAPLANLDAQKWIDINALPPVPAAAVSRMKRKFSR